ncbi:hypothetical protein [Desertivirga xinjiangensis]|uniref:hypothetical protein n=1 Tax=Desertivirga xinjiangensis TaxID=539206 RepID=UPI002109F503|nr:hypothetical protein [Pedobacter xinjiangensis]
MKRILLLLLLIPFISQSQIRKVDSTLIRVASRNTDFPKYKTQKLYSYTIGIKAFGYEEFPKILNQVDAEEFKKQYLSGLILKINDNQISYRISGNFFSDRISFRNECAECEEVEGKLSDNALRLGFERNFMYSAVQPYFGFDIGFRRNIFKGKSRAIENSGYPSYDVKTQKNGFSLAPLFGLKFNIVNHFTIAAESSLDLLYSYEKQEKTYFGENFNRTPTFTDYTKWEFLFKPVGMLSLQYNFGELY